MPGATPFFSQMFANDSATSGAPVVWHVRVRRLMSDTLTPVLAYRRLVRGDDRLAPSFLFESVVGGDRVGRYSFLGARPIAEVLAYGHSLEVHDHLAGGEPERREAEDPLRELAGICGRLSSLPRPDAPAFTGGWVGYAGYDTVRYLEPEKLNQPPPDDRHLPDLHFQLYREVIAFDHVQKTVLVMSHAEQAGEGEPSPEAIDAAERRLDELVKLLAEPIDDETHRLPPGHLDLSLPAPTLSDSNMDRMEVLGETSPGGYKRAVERCKEYIAAGDAFQIVPSQRFEFQTTTDPFDVYRSLRVVNPSPYMFYLQARGAVLIGSSPEILCKVDDGVATSRPLAGTRRRGSTEQEDQALEAELRADAKERAEHAMLVDLHRNDIGRVAKLGTIQLPELFVVERYSHVMHLSSEVRGQLRDDLDCWDALRYSLPVGTVSGAPKVRAMQIIDELEPTRRGPYGGAVGYADLRGNLDMCIALRTIVALPPTDGEHWRLHLQAGGGIVADSEPDAEHCETQAKASALAKAIELAEQAFGAQ